MYINIFFRFNKLSHVLQYLETESVESDQRLAKFRSRI